MSKERIFKTVYDASVLIGISSGFGYFVNLYDPSTSVIDYLKWVGILSTSFYLKDYLQREEIMKRIDSLNSKRDKGKTLQPKNLDLKSKRITNLATPVGDRDAVNKSYVDEKVITTLEEIASRKGDLDMGNDSIKNLKTPEPTDISHAANVNYVNKTVDKSESITLRKMTEMRPYPEKSFIKVIFTITMKTPSNSMQTERKTTDVTPDRVIPRISS